MGEGWHNNHHAYQASVRQGFRWWEIDPTYYVLKALSWCGVVWDLKHPPEAVLRNEQRLGSKVIERAAAELAATFNVEAISAALSQSLASSAPGLAHLREKVAGAHHRAADLLGSMPLPHVPTYQDIQDRATRMFASTRSLDAIVERAHRMVVEAVYARLAGAH